MKGDHYLLRFNRGLQTTRSDEGNQTFDAFEVFQNVRTGAGGLVRRGGEVYLGIAGTNHGVLTFDGTNDYLLLANDTRVTQFGLRWTFECAVECRVQTGNHYIWGNEAASTPGFTLHVTSAGAVVANIWDTASTNTTLTSASGVIGVGGFNFISVVRNGATATMYVNGVSRATSSSLSSTLLCRAPTTRITIGRHEGGSYFDGDMDYIRILEIARTDVSDGRLRWQASRAPYVLFDMTMELDAYGRVLDRGRYGLHSRHKSQTGTPAAGSGPEVIQDSPVQAIHPFVDSAGKRRLLVVAGGRVHSIEVE